MWDAVVGSRGGDLVSPEGGLIGPFNAFVHAPGVGRRLSSLGQVLRFETSIERRLSEVAIITVGARWKAEFEWWAHARMAREHGVPGEVVDAIGRGEDPPFEADDERVVYTVARQLTADGQLDQDAYAAAQRLLGDAGRGRAGLAVRVLHARVVPAERASRCRCRRARRRPGTTAARPAGGQAP